MARDSAARESEAAVAEQLGVLLAKVGSGLMKEHSWLKSEGRRVLCVPLVKCK